MPNDIQSGLAFAFEYAQFLADMGLPVKHKLLCGLLTWAPL
jgi:hypothetical protein